MADNEIIKAWEMCSKRKSISDCIGCPYRDIKECLDTMLKDSFDLYNRQKAEIERLIKLLDGAENCINEIEYALDKVGQSNSRIDDALENYNNLVKEMTEKE